MRCRARQDARVVEISRKDATEKITEEKTHAKTQRYRERKGVESGIRLGFKPVDVQQNGWNQFYLFLSVHTFASLRLCVRFFRCVFE
jgi:hypothetical protein